MKNLKFFSTLISLLLICSVVYAKQRGIFDEVKIGNMFIIEDNVTGGTSLELNGPDVNVNADSNFTVDVNGIQAIDAMESTGGFGNVGLGGISSTADNQPLTVIRNINDTAAALFSNPNTGVSAAAGYSAQVATGPGGVGLTNIFQIPTNYTLVPDWQGYGILRNFRGSGLKLIARDIDASGTDTIDLLVGGQTDASMITRIDDGGISLFDEKSFAFFDLDSSNFVALKSPSVVSSDVTFTLPGADGTNGQALVTNGSGVLSFATIDSGANATLSNLSSPTAVNQDLNPGIDDNYFLGSSSFHWTGLYTPYLANYLGSTFTMESQAGIYLDPDADGSGNEAVQIEGDVEMRSVGTDNSEIKFNEDNNAGNYVSLKAPDSIASDVIFTLPNADGTSGQVLQTDGAGILSFVTPSSGANTSLSNLITTSINEDLISDGLANWIIRTPDGMGAASKNLSLITGDAQSFNNYSITLTSASSQYTSTGNEPTGDLDTIATGGANGNQLAAFCWVKTSAAAIQYCQGQWDDTVPFSGQKKWIIGQTSDGKTRAFFSGNGGGGNGCIGTTVGEVNDGTWHHIGVVYNGGTNVCKVYLDGADVTASAAAMPTALWNSSAHYRVGGIRDTGGTFFYWNGNIDEVVVFKSALSGAEVTELYNGGVPYDLSGHSQAANLVAWYRMGDGSDVYTNFVDQVGSNDLDTPNNMSAANISTDVQSGGGGDNTGDLNFTTGSTSGDRGDLNFDAEYINSIGLVKISQTAVTLTADDQNINPADSLIQVSSDDATAANRTFTLTVKPVGTKLTLYWTGANAGELLDTGNVNLSAAWTPNADDTLDLISNGTVWLELSRSAN